MNTIHIINKIRMFWPEGLQFLLYGMLTWDDDVITFLDGLSRDVQGHIKGVRCFFDV